MLSQDEQERGADHERTVATKRWFEELFEKSVNANVLFGAGSFSGTLTIVQKQVKEIEEALIRAAEKERATRETDVEETVSPLAARGQDDLPRNIGPCSTLAQSFQRGCCDDERVSVCSVEK